MRLMVNVSPGAGGNPVTVVTGTIASSCGVAPTFEKPINAMSPPPKWSLGALDVCFEPSGAPISWSKLLLKNT